MNILSFDLQKAELARKILNETDEKIVLELMRYFSNVKPLVHKKASASAKKVTFNSISLDTRNYKFNREEANAR